MPKPRLKKQAATYVAQSRDDVARDIRVLGDLQREQARQVAYMNDRIATITAEFQPHIDQLGERIKTLQAGVHGWCEAHRAELTDGNKTKTANFITGTVSWRIDPPSVSVRNAEQLLDTLPNLGLGCYIRTKKEINKEAILADRAAADNEASPEKDAAAKRLKLLAGLTLTIKSGVEQFVITPTEVDAA